MMKSTFFFSSAAAGSAVERRARERQSLRKQRGMVVGGDPAEERGCAGGLSKKCMSWLPMALRLNLWLLSFLAW
jgi:hypothetical protein